jgi:hypothetical protein
MKPIFVAPQSALDKKPPHGSPCTRCGLCCMATLCDLAKAVFGDKPGPCPFLDDEGGGNYGCGLVKEPARYAPNRAAVVGEDTLRSAARFLIWEGLGCDARFNGEWTNEAFHKSGEEYDRANRGRRLAAMLMWGMIDG